MKFPNFLVIGAAKSGTTSLYYYLNQHPDIYMSPQKEPRFFTPEFYTVYFNDPDKTLKLHKQSAALSFEKYISLFEDVSSETAIGEASPEYIYFPDAPKRIKEYIPHAKLIAFLRDPAERAFSAYCYLLREGREYLSFEEALEQEEQRIQECWGVGWFYRTGGYYYSQLKRYFDIFDREQIRIFRQKDLYENPKFVCQDIFNFLGVYDEFVPDFTLKNVSKVPKNIFLNSLLSTNNEAVATLRDFMPKPVKSALRFLKRQNLAPKPVLPKSTRKKLVESYREDILNLQDLIQRDLSDWLSY